MRALRPLHLIGFLMACTLIACTPFSPAAATAARVSATIPSATSTMRPPATTAAPQVTRTQPETPRPPTASPTPEPAAMLCSPLEGIEISELWSPDLLKNPFDPPQPGMDGGHQGVDFAYWTRGERKSMLGHPIQAVLAGSVAAVLPLRQPYGNAVIIETPLDQLPPGWLAQVPVPTPAPTAALIPSLYCPAGGETVRLAAAAFPSDYSLYLLYAHFDQPANAAVGQEVACGQVIGGAGTTGNSVNIHLHLETRLGPSGAVFSSMGHYENTATDLEMSNYCAWRVSGLFQMFDPMRLLALQP